MSKIIESLLTANGGDSSSLLRGYTISNIVLDGVSTEDALRFMQMKCNADLNGSTYKEIMANPGNKNAKVYLLKLEKLSLQPEELEINMSGKLINELSPKVSSGDDEFDSLLSTSKYVKVQASSNHMINSVNEANADLKALIESNAADRLAEGLPALTDKEIAIFQRGCAPRHYVCFIVRNNISAKFASFAPKNGIFAPSNLSGLISATFNAATKQAPKETDKVEKRTSNIFVA